MAVQTFIDGVEVTDLVESGESKHTLNKVWQASVKIPLDVAVDGIGKFLKIVDTDLPTPIDHHGRILIVSDNDDENSGTTEYTSFGPDEIWEKRMARDGAASPTPGNYSKPTFITRNGTGPQVMEEILTQSEDGSDQALGDGDTWIELGSFAGGGPDISGAPTNWPMSIAMVRSLLQNSGALDVVVTPIDSGGNIGRVDCYNGDFGTDLSVSVVYEYGTGVNNVSLIRRTVDLTNACTKLRYLLGPKIDDQHWRRSIEGTNSDLPDPPLTNILALRAAAQAAIGVRMDVRNYDSYDDEASAAELYKRLWLVEQLLRTQPRTIVHVTPIPGDLPAFDVGDIIGVGAGAVFRGGFATAGQRVYDRTISWDTEGTVSIAEIQTSADQEAAA